MVIIMSTKIDKALYGTPKLHKSFTDVPPLHPIVSSISSFNYNPAKYLYKLLQLLQPKFHQCTVHKIRLLSSKKWRR